jgi:hypothetical protein
MIKQTLKYLALAVVLTLPVAVQAQFNFTTNNGAITITGYTGSNGVVMIPGTPTDLPVTSIGAWAFYATSVTNVLIPDSVTNLADGAFFDCESLTNVTIGSSVTSIGDWTFGFCLSLTSVSCRGNAPSLGGGNVFYGNTATIFYLSGTTNWGPVFDGLPAVLWNPAVPYNYTTNSDGITLTITGYTGSNVAESIPSTINFLPVTSIGNYAFNNSASLTSITIPNGVISIGYAAFFYCDSLTNITIPDTVTSIGGYAFDSCLSLTAITVATDNPVFSSVAGVLFNQNQTLLIHFPKGKTGDYTIPNTVTQIGEYTFAACRVSSTTIPNSITNIREASFYYCGSLTNVMIPDSVTTIGRIAFTGCTSLANVTIPKSVASFGDGAFSYCTSLTNVTLANGITRMGDSMFAHCTNLPSITIPNSVANMGYDTFANCTSLTSVTIPNSITSIGDTVFGNCTHLASITIPNSVTRIGDSTFAGCTNLKGIFFAGNAPSIVGLGIFYGDPNVTVYYLPGTTGWGTTFAGRPTTLWLLPYPTILNFEPNFGVQTNSFGFTISWATNISVVVEACTNLSNPDWQPVQTNTLTGGSTYFSDGQWTNYLGRFYRLRSL